MLLLARWLQSGYCGTAVIRGVPNDVSAIFADPAPIHKRARLRAAVRDALRSRPVALLLAAVIHLLLLWLLLKIAPEMQMGPQKGASTTVELLADQGIAEVKSSEREDQKQAAGGGAAKAAPRPAEQPPEPPPQVEEPPPPSLTVDYLRLTEADMGRLGRAMATPGTRKQGAAASGEGSTQLAGSGEGDGGEIGPNGQRLYPANWQRRPTRAELGFYLPAGVSGWGEIACRTAQNFRVEACEEIGQSSPGLSRAVREAAWQFRVRPPRIGGKPMVGAWVRIRIDYVKDEVAWARGRVQP